MLILRTGLYVSIVLAVVVTWGSMRVGYPIEVAAVRGLLAFMAGSFVAYLAELVVMTAPPRALRTPRVASAGDGDGDDESIDPAAPRGGNA